LAAAGLVSERAIREWNTWTKRIAGEAGGILSPPSLDTVGALALGADGALAAGVSRCAFNLTNETVEPNRFLASGGLLLKQPGRIGQVLLFCGHCVNVLILFEPGRYIWGRLLGVIPGTLLYGRGMQRIRYAFAPLR
jgi:hypothetical protein